MGGCCFSDGAILGSIRLSWTVDIWVVSVSWPCVGLFFRSGVIMGLWGCGLAFGFRFRDCFVLRVPGDGEAGSFCRAVAFGVWGLELWLFLITSE